MKLSELKLGDRAKLKWKLGGYEFIGKAELNDEKKLWLNNNNHGYIIDKEYDYIWDVELLN